MKFSIRSWTIPLLILIISSAGLALETRDSALPAPNAEYREKLEHGNATFRSGQRWARIGLGLSLASGALGLVAAAKPEWIDPGIAPAFGWTAAGGFACMFIGIPIMGLGADKIEMAAQENSPGFHPEGDAGWRYYRQSWKFMAWGGGVLVIAMPFAIAAALDWQDDASPLDYTAGALLLASLGLGVTGLMEQGYSWYRFSRARGKAMASVHSLASLSLQPMLGWDGQGRPGAGLRLVAGF